MLTFIVTAATTFALVVATNAQAQSSTPTKPGFGRVRLRLEVRNYLTGQNLSRASRADRRNDVAVMTGLRVAFR